MFPHTYWMRADTDGSQREANEAQAAAIYQRALRLARMSRATLGLAKEYGAPLLRRAQGNSGRLALPNATSCARR